MVNSELAFAGPPLDFTFKELASLDDALYESAESGCAAKPPLVHIDPENPDDVPKPPPLPPRPKAQLNSVAVRLSNNKLTSLNGLKAFLEHVLERPDQLMWLDISCNNLTNVDSVLINYPNLKILYMHGNKINKKSDLKCLAKLPSLQKVTLHGNPIAEHPDLRHFVSAQVPHLRSLNFGCITRLEWQDIETWRRGKPALPLVK